MRDILVKDADGNWREPTARGYAREADLQETLAQHPQLIPGVTEGAQTCREFQSAVGPADIVVVDSNGDITLVECKLASNPQVRREIIGQLFDYASRLWTMDVDEFDSRWRDRNGSSPFDGSSNAATDLRSAVASNLQAARFRLVLAVDTINKDLRRIVEFLNEALGTEMSVVAVEYVRALHEGIEILVPRSYGAEIAEVKRKREEREREIWNVEKHRQWLRQHDPDNVERFDLFLRAGEALGLEYVGTASAEPTGGLRIFSRDEMWVATLYFYYYAGQRTSVELNFTKTRQYVQSNHDLQAALNLFLESIVPEPAFEAAVKTLRESKFSRRPNVPFSALTPDSIHKLVEAARPLLDIRMNG